MKSIDILKRIKELDSLYLEWDFYYSRWIKTMSPHYQQKALKARASYEKLVAKKYFPQTPYGINDYL